MDTEKLLHRYQELQTYVGWTRENARCVQACAEVLQPFLPVLVDDFYTEVERHPNVRKVITGGPTQIARLKGTLLQWLKELLAGPYDEAYVVRRWKVGWRHVEIGLDQVYTNVAISRLRHGLLKILEESWTGKPEQLSETRMSLNLLMDLDLAIIEDAYQAEYLARQQRVERLAAIGQVAGGVAHELRNPLNVIKTSVYYLLHARNPTPEKQAEHLQRVEKHVTLADGVITALSSFAKMPVPNQQPISVCRCIQEALETNPVPEKIRVAVDCDPNLPPVLADHDQLRIVFGNLIRNAREAMVNGGTLTIRATVAAEGVDIAFVDTGVGIAPDDLSRVMEPLYSTKARGLGLGLAIARSILDKNRGSMRVASEVGQGSTFTVRVPSAGS